MIDTTKNIKFELVMTEPSLNTTAVRMITSPAIKYINKRDFDGVIVMRKLKRLYMNSVIYVS